MVDEYEMEDGSNFFDHYYYDVIGSHTYIKNKPEITGFDNESPYYHREAWFYALVLYDSARYMNLVL